MSFKNVSNLVILFSVIFAGSAFAEGNGVANGAGTHWYAIAACLGMALATFGGAMGQGKALSTALDGIARNPGAQNKIFVPMIVGLALIESLVLLSFVVANSVAGKI